MIDAPADLTLEAVLLMSEANIASLPPGVASQVYEMQRAAQEQQEMAEKRRQQSVHNLGLRIAALYQQRLGMRQELEQRWLKDIRRYNGQYDPDVLRALQNREYGSQMYVPLVRRVCNIVEARLTDLLFPTEERNWAVESSPVPELVQAESMANRLPPDQMIPAGPDGAPLQASAVALGIRELRDEANSAAEGMTREIDDQLRQANYPAAARRAIHEAMVIGTGVLKGPMVLSRVKKVWVNGRIERKEDLSPTVVQVSAWDFFPDMSARTLKESESEIERHYKTKADMARLAQQPGFDAEAIRQVLTAEPGHTRDWTRDQLRESSGMQGVHDPRYLILEYHGPVEREELEAMGIEVPDDNLLVFEGVVWTMEDGTVLKAIVNPMDTEDRPFSVFNWEKDPGSIFGFSLSYELADLAETSNSAFRASLDNLGLSVGPQIVVNDKVIRPENGKWAIEPNKIWRMVKADADARAAFAFFQIDSRLSELLGVFDRSKAMMEEIGGPVMAMQGQEAPSYLDTARGASIAHNSANIWMRRAVRNYDDDVTSCMIQRFIDWNMQYSVKTDIKGDLLPIARGTSALLEAEGQMTKMGVFMQAASAVPMPFARKVAQLRQMAKAMRLEAADMLPDDEEVKRIGDQIDSQAPPPNPEVERIKLRQAELADKQAEREHELLIENQRNELRMAEIASRDGLTSEDARRRYGIEELKTAAKLEDSRQQRSHEAQMLNAELAAKMQTGTGV